MVSVTKMNLILMFVYETESDPTTRPLFIDTNKKDLILSEEKKLHKSCTNSTKITHCDSFKRINIFLSKYQKWIMSNIDHDNNDNNNIQFWDIVNDTETGYNNSNLLDDQYHLMMYHRFDDIYDHLSNKCSKNIDCICLKRNYRDKRLKNKCLSLYFGNTDNEINIEQIMDSIHCYFCHSYHLGLLLNKKETEYINGNTTNNNNNNNDSSTTNTGGSGGGGGIFSGLPFSYHSYINPNNIAYTDSVLRSVRKHRKSSPKFYQHINDTLMKGDFDKIRKIKSILKKKKEFMSYHNLNKFMTDFNIQNEREQEGKTDGAVAADNNNNDQYVLDDCRDCFGVRYDYYNEDKQYFVNAKYESLRFELLNNLLSIKQFNILYIKGTNHKRKEYSKYLKADGKSGIKRDTEISLEHILSLMAYCNFNEIRRKFIATFYKTSKQQTDEIIKLHSSFGHLGRNLFEIIRCFGKKTTNKDRFYIYINNKERYFLDPTFCVQAPLSTTNKIQIAMIGSIIHNGLIIECKQNIHWDPIKYFNCKTISDFPNENELLFINNDINSERFILNKIINVNINNCYDYSIWFIIFKIIYSMINGQQFKTKHLNQIILQNCINLLKLQLINNNHKEIIYVPKYIQNLFKLYFEKVDKIKIRWPDIQIFYNFMKPFIFDIDYNFLDLKNIFTIFRNCTDLIISGSLNKDLNFSTSIMECLYKHLSLLSSNSNEEISKLKYIQIEFIKDESSLSFDDAINEYNDKFNKINFNLSIKYPQKKWRAFVVQKFVQKM